MSGSAKPFAAPDRPLPDTIASLAPGATVTYTDTVQIASSATGMPITRMQEYVDLVRAGEGTEPARLELLEALSDDSVIGRFISKRGEGLHHVSLRVPDLIAVVAKLKQEGVRLVSDEIKVGAGRHRYVFVHPSSTGGVLLELVESGH